MRDDRNSASGQYLITTRMIEMVMTVHRELDRQFRERMNLGDQFFDCRGRKEGVEDQNAIVTDYKTGITGRQSS